MSRGLKKIKTHPKKRLDIINKKRSHPLVYKEKTAMPDSKRDDKKERPCPQNAGQDLDLFSAQNPSEFPKGGRAELNARGKERKRSARVPDQKMHPSPLLRGLACRPLSALRVWNRGAVCRLCADLA